MGTTSGWRRYTAGWDGIARVDPLWAILGEPAREGGFDLERFFATGAEEAAHVLARLDELGLATHGTSVLDLGCGLGRLAPGLAPRFERYLGVDVAPAMVERARELHHGLANATFELVAAPSLGSFADGSVDLVYANLVLQHLPGHRHVESYLYRLVALVAPRGALVFQMPTRLPARNRLQPRRRLNSLLLAAGAGQVTLTRRLGLHPVGMVALSEPRLRSICSAAGARVRAIEPAGDDGFASRRFYVERES